MAVDLQIQSMVIPKSYIHTFILWCISINTGMWCTCVNYVTVDPSVGLKRAEMHRARLVVSYGSEWYTSVFGSNPTLFLKWEILSKADCRNAKCSECFFPDLFWYLNAGHLLKQRTVLVPALSFHLLIIEKLIKILKLNCETHWNHF